MEYAAAPRNKLSNTFEPAVQPETRPIENIVSAKQLLGRAATAILAHFFYVSRIYVPMTGKQRVHVLS